MGKAGEKREGFFYPEVTRYEVFIDSKAVQTSVKMVKTVKNFVDGRMAVVYSDASWWENFLHVVSDTIPAPTNSVLTAP
ncbi:MAG: hypothetical protein LUE17_03370 [Planctomycetaceae bacterium]|nr:hypothetical protein [Planctomycetaceae bacterium]